MSRPRVTFEGPLTAYGDGSRFDFPVALRDLFVEAWAIVEAVAYVARGDAPAVRTGISGAESRARFVRWFGNQDDASLGAICVNITSIANAVLTRQIRIIYTGRAARDDGGAVAYTYPRMDYDYDDASTLRIFFPDYWAESILVDRMARSLVQTFYHELSHVVSLTQHMRLPPNCLYERGAECAIALAAEEPRLTLLNADSFGYYFDALINPALRSALTARTAWAAAFLKKPKPRRGPEIPDRPLGFERPRPARNRRPRFPAFRPRG